MGDVRIPPVKTGQIKPVDEVALQRLPNFETQKVNATLEVVSQQLVPWVNRSMQAAANHKVVDAFTNNFLPKMAELKRKALETNDYAKFRNDATNELNSFFNQFKDPFTRKSVEQIRDQKTAWVGNEIINFEERAIAANEAKRMSGILENMSRQAIEDPESIRENIDSLSSMGGSFNVITGDPVRGQAMLKSYVGQLASIGVQSAVDSFQNTEALTSFFKETTPFLTPQQELTLGGRIEKKKEILLRAQQREDLAIGLLTNEIPFQYLNKDHTTVLEEYTQKKGLDAVDVATKTNYVPKSGLAQMQAQIASGSPGALDAAQKIDKLSKMNSIIARQISDEVQANATKFLQSYYGSGDLEKASKDATSVAKQSKFEVENIKKVVRGEVLKAKPGEILDHSFKVSNDREAYHNMEMLADYAAALERNSINYGLNLEDAKLMAKRQVQNRWGLSEYGASSFFWFNTLVPTKMPLERVQQELAKNTADENKQWALEQFRHQVKSPKLGKRDVFFEWDGEDEVSPNYQVYVRDGRQLTPMLDENWNYVYFMPDYAKYLKTKGEQIKMPISRSEAKRTLKDQNG